MYKVFYKKRSPYENWQAVGTYSSEQSAIAAAMNKKKQGAMMVRVTDKSGSVVFTN
jgi:cytidine deaminase